MTNKIIGKEYNVLDQGSLTLIDLMPHPSSGINPDLSIVNAARTSFLGESKGDEKDKKLLFYLMRNHHDTPFEMVEFKFRIHAPLLVFWQLVRHRTAHLNLSSGRYIEFDEDTFYVPETWRRQSQSNKQASDGELAHLDETGIILDLYKKYGDDSLYRYMADESYGLNELLSFHYKNSYDIYKTLLKHGVAKEQARLFLPGFSVYYTAIWKIDARNLMNFLKLRMANDAQYEIRMYANAMYEVFKECLPWTSEAFEQFVLGKSNG